MSSSAKSRGFPGQKDPIRELSQRIETLVGVQLGEKQRPMIESRLNKRCLDLGLDSWDAYLEFFLAHEESETKILVSLLTTHHTYFFREFSHFEFLRDKVLPGLIPLVRSRADKTLRVWSAACSRGQEVYSLAMFLEAHLKTMAPDLTYEILGTDVDPESVEIGRKGVYLWKDLKEVPLAYLGNHWARGKGEIQDFVKVKDSLKSRTRFGQMNLFQLPVGSAEKFDVIFCRNVLIYFRPDQIKAVGLGLLKFLSPAGCIVVGVSESLSRMDLPVTLVGPSVYGHLKPASQPASSVTMRSDLPPPARAVAPGPIKVLCVDDSPSIHSLLKRILTKENGFEVVGNAVDGRDAAEKLKLLTVDVMTLDIHMPNLTGVEYLEKYYSKSHPPVVMVTAVSRDNSSLALKALELGAADFVEKPALADLVERGDEIRTKLRCAFNNRSLNPLALNLDHAFKKSSSVLTKPEEKVRVLVMSMAERHKLKAILPELRSTHAPLVLALDGVPEILSELGVMLSREFGIRLDVADSMASRLPIGTITLVDLKAQGESLRRLYQPKDISIMIFGKVTKRSAEVIRRFSGSQILLEDTSEGASSSQVPTAEESALEAMADDLTPVTSFPYLSNEFLCRK